MAGIGKLHFNVFVNPEFHIVRNTDKKVHTGDRILAGIDRSNHGKPFLCSLLVECTCIILLNIA